MAGQGEPYVATICWEYGCMQVKPNNFSRFQGLIKTQHNLVTSRSQIVHGSQTTIPNGKHYRIWAKILNRRDMGKQIE